MGDEPGYFCSCINAMAVSRAEFAAQSLELQQEHQDRVQAHCSEERWRSAHEAQSLELQAFRDAEKQRTDDLYSAHQQNELLRAELQAVREALGKYGQHNTGCDEGVLGYIDGRPDHRSGYCSCGLRAALKPSRGA